MSNILDADLGTDYLLILVIFLKKLRREKLLWKSCRRKKNTFFTKVMDYTVVITTGEGDFRCLKIIIQDKEGSELKPCSKSLKNILLAREGVDCQKIWNAARLIC